MATRVGSRCVCVLLVSKTLGVKLIRFYWRRR